MGGFTGARKGLAGLGTQKGRNTFQTGRGFCGPGQYGLATGWLQLGDRSATSWLQVSYRLATGWLQIGSYAPDSQGKNNNYGLSFAAHKIFDALSLLIFKIVGIIIRSMTNTYNGGGKIGKNDLHINGAG